MRSYVFPYAISFGKNDSVDAEIRCEVTEKQAIRLERSAKEGGKFRLSEDECIQDIYDRVYFAILSEEKKILSAYPTPVRDALSWNEDYDLAQGITEVQIDAYLAELDIHINYPAELQMLNPSAPSRRTQKKHEAAVVDRADVNEYLKDPANREKVVYVDGGATLFWIPPKFKGLFTIESGVAALEEKVFANHKGITEITIEEGISEIPAWTFQGCTGLEKVTLPKSVKRICFNAFTGCSALKEIQLPDGLEELDSTAIRACYSLTTLRIPSTVKKISAHITSYMAGLKELIFEGLDTEIDDSRGGDFSRIIICAKPGSKAEQFAIIKKIRHKTI